MSQRQDTVRNSSASARNDPREPQPQNGIGELMSSWCNMWGNLVTDLGQAISSPNCGGTYVGANQRTGGTYAEANQRKGGTYAEANQRTGASPSQQQESPIRCEPVEVALRWCGLGGPAGSRYKSSDGTEVSGRYDDGSTQAKVDISTGSSN